ncbi:MAG: 50S ribosomal protein L11 methyltransferase, partial [Chloroflexi bacterium]|nr:50S ribosomal protein L11 methyltransferase [Chloroflexota bacterium]
MTLLEISVRADGEAAEAISELFNRVGRGGAVIEEVPDTDPRNVVVKTYLACDDQLEAKRRALEEGAWHLAQIYPIPDPEFRELQDADWANAWKQYHPVQHVGERIVLQPTWRDYEPQPHELV